MDLKKATFQGYKRENGRVGVRNHVVILPVDDLSNAAAEAVANNVKGTLAIPHPYGRLQFGADLDLHFRTLIGAGANPNVAAVVVIGIEEGWTKRVVDGIAATGKPVTGFGIELHGDHDTIMRASKVAKGYLQYASELQRVECSLNELWVSCKCGESDTTSGCGSNPTVGIPRNGWVSVRADLIDRDRGARERLASELSNATSAVVCTLALEDGRLVRYALYERGSIVDEYQSVPEYYGPVPPGDVVALGANPTVVSRLTGADPARVRAVARTASSPDDLPSAPELLAQIAELMGLQS